MLQNWRQASRIDIIGGIFHHVAVLIVTHPWSYLEAIWLCCFALSKEHRIL